MAKKKFCVSASGREFLGTAEIEAETREEAEEKYRELWEAGLVEAYDYEMDEFSITEYEEEGEADE